MDEFKIKIVPLTTSLDQQSSTYKIETTISTYNYETKPIIILILDCSPSMNILNETFSDLEILKKLNNIKLSDETDTFDITIVTELLNKIKENYIKYNSDVLLYKLNKLKILVDGDKELHTQVSNLISFIESFPTTNIRRILKNITYDKDNIPIVVQIQFSTEIKVIQYPLNEYNICFNWEQWEIINGNTALFDAIDKGISMSKNFKHKSMIIITDGVDNVSSSCTINTLKSQVEEFIKTGNITLISPSNYSSNDIHRKQVFDFLKEKSFYENLPIDNLHKELGKSLSYNSKLSNHIIQTCSQHSIDSNSEDCDVYEARSTGNFYK